MRIRDWSSDVCSSDLQFFEGAVMRRFLLTGGLAAAAIVGLCGPVAAAVTVVASIKPVHSLVAGVMAGAASPHLIVQGGAPPPIGRASVREGGCNYGSVSVVDVS